MRRGKFKQLVTIGSVSALFVCGAAQAELASLSDDELSDVDGAGVGLVFEDFVFNAVTDTSNASSPQTFKISGIKSSKGEDVEITVSQLYIANAGSNYGGNLNPVNLGRLTNPYEIELLDGDDIGLDNVSVLQFAAPKKVAQNVGYDCLNAAATEGSGACSSRPAGVDATSGEAILGERPDLGLKLQVAVGANSPDNINIHAKSAVFDGSYLRLWGDDSKNQLVGEYRLNLYTPELSINTCDASGQSCGDTIYMRNFELELALGNQFQPMSIAVTEAQDGSIAPGNFVFEIQAIAHEYMNELPTSGKCDASNPCSANAQAAYNFFNDYYTNSAYRSNLRIGQLEIGDISGSGQNFGSARVEGMLIQYLKISSHDLAN